MEIGLLLGTALMLGALHSVEPDHVAAVSAFVVRRPRRRAALGYGLRWALGHGGIVLVVGTALLMLRMSIDPDAGAWLERLVGVWLVLLGGWVLAGERPESRDHRHRHAATAIGAFHGLAGTAPVVALIPLARMDSVVIGSAYLLAFGIGTAAAMALYAMFAGVVASRAARRSERLARAMARATGVATIAVGLIWLLY